MLTALAPDRTLIINSVSSEIVMIRKLTAHLNDDCLLALQLSLETRPGSRDPGLVARLEGLRDNYQHYLETLSQLPAELTTGA